MTKRNKPVTKLVPRKEETNPSIFGKMKGTAQIKGDLILSIGEDWAAYKSFRN